MHFQQFEDPKFHNFFMGGGGGGGGGASSRNLENPCVFGTCVAYHSNINYLDPALEACTPLPRKILNPGYGPAEDGITFIITVPSTRV